MKAIRQTTSEELHLQSEGRLTDERTNRQKDKPKKNICLHTMYAGHNNFETIIINNIMTWIQVG